MSEPEGSDDRPAEACAAGALASTPAKTGPTLLSPELMTAGGLCEDTTTEQLDWGSIDDEDGAFGQLSEAGKSQDADPAASPTPVSSARQTSSVEKLEGATGAAATITIAAQPDLAGAGLAALAGSPPKQSTLHGADLILPEAEALRPPFGPSEWTAVGPEVAELSPQSGHLHEPPLDLTESQDPPAGEAAATIDGHLPDAPLQPSTAAINGPVPKYASPASPDASERETTRKSLLEHADKATFDIDFNAGFCGEAGHASSSAAPATEPATRSHAATKVRGARLLKRGEGSRFWDHHVPIQQLLQLHHG